MNADRITLHVTTCWIIRSRMPDGRERFYEALDIWCASPSYATIFRTWEAAERSLKHFRERCILCKGEVIDAVPLYGALLTVKS